MKRQTTLIAAVIFSLLAQQVSLAAGYKSSSSKSRSSSASRYRSSQNTRSYPSRNSSSKSAAASRYGQRSPQRSSSSSSRKAQHQKYQAQKSTARNRTPGSSRYYGSRPSATSKSSPRTRTSDNSKASYKNSQRNAARKNSTAKNRKTTSKTNKTGNYSNAYLQALKRIKQAERADEDDDVADPYVGPAGLIDRNQAARDREVVTRFELKALGVSDDVTEATIAKGKERGRFNQYEAKQFANRVVEVIGDNATVGNSTSEKDRAEIIKKLAGVRLGGYQERQTLEDLKNVALDRAGIPRVQLSAREKIKGKASATARLKRAGEVSLLGRDFKNPADYHAAAKLNTKLAKLVKSGADQAEINRAVADFISAVGHNAEAAKNDNKQTDNNSDATSSDAAGRTGTGRFQGVAGTTGNTGEAASATGGQTDTAADSQADNSTTAGSSTGNTAGGQAAAGQANTSTPATETSTATETATQPATDAPAETGSQSKSTTPAKPERTVVGQVTHDIGGATWVFTVYPDGTYEQNLVDNKTGKVIEEGPSGTVQVGDGPEVVEADATSDGSEETSSEDSGSDGDDDEDEDEEEDKDETDTSTPSEDDNDDEGESDDEGDDSTPNPARDPEASNAEVDFLLSIFPSERRKQEKNLQTRRDGGHTDPVEGSEPIRMTPEQFQAFLKRLSSEGKKQERNIENRQGGGHTDPAEGKEDRNRKDAPLTPRQLKDLIIKAGGGHTDPVDGDNSGSAATGAAPAGVPGLIGGGAKAKVTGAAGQLQNNANRVKAKVRLY